MQQVTNGMLRQVCADGLVKKKKMHYRTFICYIMGQYHVVNYFISLGIVMRNILRKNNIAHFIVQYYVKFDLT